MKIAGSIYSTMHSMYSIFLFNIPLNILVGAIDAH